MRDYYRQIFEKRTEEVRKILVGNYLQTCFDCCLPTASDILRYQRHSSNISLSSGQDLIERISMELPDEMQLFQ